MMNCVSFFISFILFELLFLSQNAIATDSLLANVANEWPILLRPTVGSSNQFGISIAASASDHILIGASHENKAKFVSTGALYACSLSKIRSVKQEKHNQSTTIVCEEFKSSVIHQQQQDHRFLGATLESAGNRSVVCAPTHFNEFYPKEKFPNGRCWLMTSDDIDKGTSNQNDHISRVQTLAPFENASRQILVKKYYYSHALGGFSAKYMPDSKQLLLGAPGHYDWSGGLIQYNLTKGEEDDSNETRPSPARLYYYRSSYLTSYIYFGFAVGSGKFFGDQKTYAAVSAPRTQQAGAIFLFPLDNLPASESPTIETEIKFVKILLGQQFGEYFGASLECADLNKDGLTDLIIGAPYHSLSTKDRRDNGAVYVFLSTADEFVLSVKLTGRKEIDSLFGYSMATTDLNQDSFVDLIVGAPYENEGQGCLYVYLGSRNALENNFNQRICSSDLVKQIGHTLLGLGVSVYAKLDVDLNSYPDIVAGAHLSDSAVVLRSRPVARLVGELRFSNNSVNLKDVKSCQIDSTRFVCVDLLLCVRLAGVHLPDRLPLRTRLQADSKQLNVVSRAILRPSSQLSASDVQLSADGRTIEFTALVSSSQQLVCHSPFSVIIKNGIEDILTPLQFSVTHNLTPEMHSSKCADCIQLINVNRALNASLPFKTGCRNDGVCVADFQLVPTARPFPVRSDDPDSSEKSVEWLLLGLHRAVRVRLQIRNKEENAYQTQLRVLCNPPLPLQQMESHCVENESRKGELLCSVGNPFATGQQDIFFTFDLTREAVDLYQKLHFQFEISTSSQVIDKSKLKSDLIIPLKRFASIDYKRGTRLSPIMFKSNDADKSSVQSFDTLLQFTKDNYSPVSRIRLSFWIPASIESNRLITSINVENAQSQTLQVNCSQNQIQPTGRALLTFNHTNSHSSSDATMINEEETGGEVADVERFNEMEEESTDILPINPNRSKSRSKPLPVSFILNCENAKCEQWTCDAGPINAGRQLLQFNLSGRFDLNAFDNSFGRNHTRIDVRIRHEVRILDEGFDERHNQLRDRGVVRLKFQRLPSKEKIPLWIYVASALLALILFAILVVSLIKIGFFKRNKREEMKKLMEQMNSNRAMQSLTSANN